MADDGEVFEGEVFDGPRAAESMTAIDSVTRSEIDMQISTAKKYPRNLQRVKDEMVTMATLDVETAEQCFYALKRKDADGGAKIIQGESIRLAEIALSCFGNIRCGSRYLGETEDGKQVRVLGVAHDLEKNVAVAREVTRRITGRSGKRYGEDMIAVTIAAASAIAFRNAAFSVIPRALVKPAFNKAKEVAVGKTKSITEQRSRVISKLKAISPVVTMEKILRAVNRTSVEEITWEDIEFLIGVGVAIKDGFQKVEEAFPDPAAPESVRVDDLRPAADATAATAGQAATPPAESEGDAPSPAPPEGPTEAPKPSSAGVPWTTITGDQAAAIRARLKKLGFEEVDLMATLGDDTIAFEDMPAAKLAQAEKLITAEEERRSKKKG